MVVLTSLNILYLAFTLFKFNTILKHVLWVNENGPGYRVELDRLRARIRSAATVEDVYKITVMPQFSRRSDTIFGIKEMRTRSAIERYRRGRGIRSWLIAPALQVFLFVYDFVFVALAGGFLLTLTGMMYEPALEHAAWARVTSAALALTFLATILLLTLEPTVIYSQLGSYGSVFHRPVDYVNREVRESFVSDLFTLIFLALAALYIDAAVLSLLVNLRIDDFGYPDLAGTQGLFHCAYSVFMTFALSTQLTPRTDLGQLTLILFTVHGLSLLTVGLAALFGRAKFVEGRN